LLADGTNLISPTEHNCSPEAVDDRPIVRAVNGG
jgi:hypothetical protein